MFSKVMVIFILLSTVTINARAEVIILKDGRTVNGVILEKDDRKIKIEENGQTVTYYRDQIESVNGAPLAQEPKVLEPEAIKSDVVQPAQNSESVTKKSGAKIEPPNPSGLSKRALIRKFMEVFGTREAMTQNFDRLVGALPPNKAEEVRKILNVEEVIDNIMPLYDKYFTQEDLEYYVAFYSSEQGKKFLKALPEIMKESVEVNIEYFKTKLPEKEK